jgi:hypothetical protein
MGTVVPSPSSKPRLALAGLGLLMVAGCAASAPSLPADTTSVNRVQSVSLDTFSKEDAAMSCDQIAAERRDIDRQKQEANGRIEDNRTQNQVAGYFGAQLLLPLLATEGNQAEKDAITRLYGRRDTLIKLSAVKGCKAEL